MRRTHLFGLLSAAVLAATATSQTPIAGNIHDGAGGPLLAGRVYHATGNLHVPAGQTLTVQAGAVVKFDGTPFTVDGTLLCQGSAAQPVVFTSIHDDAAGGDTNGNGGATSPAPTQWYGLRFQDPSDGSRLAHTIVRYAGYGYWPVVDLWSADVRLTDCRLTDSSWGGLRVDPGSRPTVARCRFERLEATPAIFGLSVRAVPGFTGNSAVGCPAGNYLRIDDGAVAGQVTLSPGNAIGGALVLNANLVVPAGAMLTLEAGLVVKTLGLPIDVAGTLLARGTSSAPVVLTSLRDDAAGGDTNGDGTATSPSPLDWYGLRFGVGADPSALAFTVVRYTGYGYWPAVDLLGADITLSDCTVSDAAWGGLHLDAAARPAVTRCTFARVQGSPAVYGVAIDAVPGFTDCTATACPGGPYLRIDHGTLAGDLTLDPSDALNGALVFNTNLTVPAQRTLTLNPGAVLKAVQGVIFAIDGTLHAQGTASRPVVLTTFPDDAAGGDTNGDGSATTPSPTYWYGLRFTDAADASTLAWTTVRFTGYGYLPAVDLVAADITASDCVLSDATWGGLRLDRAARPRWTRGTFERIQGFPAVFGVDIAAVAGFDRCTATDCGVNAYLRIDHCTVSGHATIAAQNQIGGALVHTGNLLIPVAARLSIGSGVVLKQGGGLVVEARGRLDVDGPVVFTSFQDDAYGGDTNGDGQASSPGPNHWYGLRIHETATGTLDRALIRYTGYSYTPALVCLSSLYELRRSRVEFGGWGGFSLVDAALTEDLVAYGNGSDGIRLDGGSFVLRRCTSAFNSGNGILATAAFTGAVRSTLAWGNGTTDFAGLTAGRASYCDGRGLTGGTGNRNVDPQFETPGLGDLRLRRGSPCIDAGDPGDRPADRDPLGFPRLLDGNLDGAQRVDIGAHEFDHVILLVTGRPTPAGSLQITSMSTPPILLAALFIGLPATVPTPLLNFGNLFVDLAGPNAAVMWPTNGSLALGVPAGLTTPLPLTFQLVGLCATFPLGNASNPAFVTIE